MDSNEFDPQKTSSLLLFYIAANSWKHDDVRRGSRSSDRGPHGAGGPRAERSGGSGSLRAVRSNEPGSLWEARSRRRQECSSEHIAWTPRPSTWRLSFFVRMATSVRRRVQRTGIRPGVIPALTSDRSAPGPIRQGTYTDPRPCTGAILLTGNDSRCQPNFVVFGFEPTRYCETNLGRRRQPWRRRSLQGSPPACPWPRVLIRSRHPAVALEKRRWGGPN